MNHLGTVATILLLAPFLGGDGRQGREQVYHEDFSGKQPGGDWKTPSRSWKIEGAELRSQGGGTVEFAKPLSGDFALTFNSWTEEKANVEVTLADRTGERTLFTFAFLGRFHDVLQGPRSCILKGGEFKSVAPRMWIFPGRMFDFEVRRSKNQYQMFLDRELGPFFVDENPPGNMGEFLLRINVYPEGPTDKVRLDNLKLVLPAGK